jgi:hypothetical protein
MGDDVLSPARSGGEVTGSSTPPSMQIVYPVTVAATLRAEYDSYL